MNFFIKAIAAFCFLTLAGICSAVFLFLDNSPEIVSLSQISPEKFQQTLSFVEKSDPRALQPGTAASLTLREEDLDLFLNYALENYENGAGKVSISEGMIDIIGSIRLPSALVNRYVNLQVIVSNEGETLEVNKLRLGKIQIPGALTRILMNSLKQELITRVPEYAEISAAITGYEIANKGVIISYLWQPELLGHLSKRGSGLLIADDDKERLTLYMLRLADIAGNPNLPTTISLARIISPMFAFAESRSGDPVKENRTAIMAMSLYVMDIDISQISGDSESVPAMPPHKITLAGRQDFAKHFITSAAIAVSADTNIADSVGLMKEIDDALVGSGFSFTDVGADRAGVRFAEFATSNPRNAVLLQRRLAGDLPEDVFIPSLVGLPEFMPEDEFVARYGGINQPEFQRVIIDIEERISRLPLFNSL